MTDPASIAEEDYDEHEWYVAKSLPSAFNDYATAYFACTDKNPTNAIRIAHADTHLAAVAIVDALNTADACDADYLDLFAHVFELKKQCAALIRERDVALSALDAALDRIDTLNRAAFEGMGYCSLKDPYEAINRIHAALKAVAVLDWPFKIEGQPS